jgi:hypothetical protein
MFAKFSAMYAMAKQSIAKASRKLRSFFPLISLQSRFGLR